MFNKLRREVAKNFKENDVRDFPVLDSSFFPNVKKVSYEEYALRIQEFNKMIGWPCSRMTNKKVPLADYQIKYEWDVEYHHKVIVNKTRKGGFTDGRIRAISRQIFGRYAGHDTLIVAGNELAIAKEILDRFNELFENGVVDKDGKKWAYGDIVMRYSQSPQPTVEFYNGARVLCFAASKSGKAQSFRGLDDVISIFMLEAAHSGAIDDNPIYTALTPNLANRPDGDLVFESTPNGRRGFYYDTWMDSLAGKNNYHRLEVNWEQAVKAGILSKQYVEQQRLDPRIDFEQEYNCKFTTTKRAAIPADEIRQIESEEDQPIDLSSFLGYENMRD